MTGADQFILFSSTYSMVAVCALFLASTVICLLVRRVGIAAFFSSPDVQVLGLLSLAILAMPSALRTLQSPMAAWLPAGANVRSLWQ